MEMTTSNTIMKKTKKAQDKRYAMCCRVNSKGQFGMPKTKIPMRTVRPRKILCREY